MKACPFCPGNEEMTPPATAVYTEEGVLADEDSRIHNWQARCFPNLFPAVIPDPGPPTREWLSISGRGFHEIIVEAQSHDSSPATFSDDQLNLMIAVYRDRYNNFITMKGVEYVSIFKNWGEEAGASLSHTHSQLVALPIMPPILMREMHAISSAPSCPYCNIVEREASSNRLIAQNENWIHIAPFYSQTPYETWILPKRHLGNLCDLDAAQHRDLASIIGEALRRLADLLKDPPYNYMISQLPSNYRYHLNISIQPVTSKIAGFEKNTGVYINPIPPEQAAAELQEM
jgi:UDPglucose--hexose-1-phosphate uridylyltransferase